MVEELWRRLPWNPLVPVSRHSGSVIRLRHVLGQSPLVVNFTWYRHYCDIQCHEQKAPNIGGNITVKIYKNKFKIKKSISSDKDDTVELLMELVEKIRQHPLLEDQPTFWKKTLMGIPMANQWVSANIFEFSAKLSNYQDFTTFLWIHGHFFE